MAPLVEKMGSRFSSRPKDARRSARKQVGSKAWIRVEGGFATRECTIVDISDRGARLSLGTPQPISGPFNLLFSRSESPGRRCRVKWRRGTQLGVEFV